MRETPAANPWNVRRDPAVWGVFGVYFALAVTYSYVMELGYAPDEVTRHFPYVAWLATEKRLPPADPHEDCGSLELHPPLYYALLTPVYAATESLGRRATLRALRWTSPFLVLLALLLWFAVIRLACGNDRATSLFALALTGWWPDLFADAGALNNDVGAILCAALLLYLMCVRDSAARSLWSAGLWGAVTGVGGLIKSTVLTTGLPVVLLGLAWQHGRRFYADGRYWTRTLIAGAACTGVCAWWYLRNLALHGAMLPVPQGYCLIPHEMSKLEALREGLIARLLIRAVNGLWMSVFAGPVWFPDETHVVVYNLLRVLTGLGVAGLAYGGWRLVRGRARLAQGQAWSFMVPALSFAVLFLSCVWASIFVHAGVYRGGRYLLPFLPGLTIPFALALRQVFPGRVRRTLMVATAVFFLALNFLVCYHLLTYWNPYVLSTAGRFE